MTAFFIGPDEQAAICAAIAIARTRMIPLDVVRRMAIPDEAAAKPVVTLADRARVGDERVNRQSQHVELAMGWRLSISCEEQPAGICLHFSLSSPKAGRIPRPEAMKLILEAASIVPKGEPHAWLEEFLVDGRPGGIAVNCLVLIEERVAGHA